MLTIFFLVITLLSVLLLYLGSRGNRKVLLYFLPWAVFVGGLSLSGFFQNTDAVPPRVIFVLGPAVLSVLMFAGAFWQKLIPTNYLLAIHALRLPVEITLHQLYLAAKVPVIMTFLGWNFDIVMGLSAILLLLYSWFFKKALNPIFYKLWNVTGLLFLAVIVFIAILSAPLPVQQFAFDQPNIAILEFPYTYLPAMVVPIVLLAHVLGLKQGVVPKRPQ